MATHRFAWLLILLSGLGFVKAIRDDARGLARERWVVSRAESPKLFRSVMIFEWSRASVALGGGLLLLQICRRADRLDPFSPKFQGRAALEECERVLDAEIEKKHSPLRY